MTAAFESQPSGWFDWARQYRNTFIHRGRRHQQWHEGFGLRLPRHPERSEMQSLILSTYSDGLAEPAESTLACVMERAQLAVAHPASVTRNLVHALDVLSGLGIAPRVLFGPEHGWAGHAQDMVGVGDGAKAGARVVSLYGKRYEDLSPRREHLDGIDVVVVDLQDIGSRYYTFVWTAVLVARACRDAGIRVVVLDRPNPLGGVAIEGRLQEPGFRSFVGLERVPIRHGLTLGEVVAWRVKLEGYAELVTVVRATGIDREATWR